MCFSPFFYHLIDIFLTPFYSHACTDLDFDFDLTKQNIQFPGSNLLPLFSFPQFTYKLRFPPLLDIVFFQFHVFRDLFGFFQLAHLAIAELVLVSGSQYKWFYFFWFSVRFKTEPQSKFTLTAFDCMYFFLFFSITRPEKKGL